MRRKRRREGRRKETKKKRKEEDVPEKSRGVRDETRTRHGSQFAYIRRRDTSPGVGVSVSETRVQSASANI